LRRTVNNNFYATYKLQPERTRFLPEKLAQRQAKKQFWRFFSALGAMPTDSARTPRVSIPAGAQRLLFNSQLRLDLIA
jgi:hypothetical protein